ncbi:MAG: Heavy-metal resistance [Rhodospirillales bacterium]|jgi:uncharacterized membrane protein|nr:Heavy-metal resistance [Rhodospirillales bacterium]
MTPRWWAGIFFASLAVNVLLAGVIVAAYLNRDNRDRELVHRMTVYTVPWAWRVVGEDIGVLARRIYAKTQAELARDRQTLTQDYAAVNEILSAETFDREAFASATAKLRADVAAAQSLMHDAMGEFAAGLTVEQRRKLTDFVADWSKQREQRAIRRDEMIEQKERRENRAN